MPLAELTTPPTRGRTRRFAAALTRPGWPRLIAVAALLSALALALYGPFALNGGFVADDWLNAAKYQLAPEPGFWGAVDNYQTPSRPVAAVYVSATHALLGLHFRYHLALAVLLAAFLSVAFYLFLRALGLRALPALAAATLLLVFPSSDSTRFWATGSQINLFIGLYLVAATIAVTGRRRFGPAPTAPAVLTQLLASALAVIAVGGYEIVAPAVLLSFVLYAWTARDRRGALWRWLLDAIPTVVVLILYTRRFGDHASELTLTDVRQIADGAVSVLSYTFVPVRTFPRWVVFGALAAVLVAIAATTRLLPASPRRDAIARWLWPIVLAIVCTAIGYAMLLPAAERYPLWAPGVQNRSNCFAALGLSALAVFVVAAVAALAAAVVPRIGERTRERLRWSIAGVLMAALLVISTVRVEQDRTRWEAVPEIQGKVLSSVQAIVPAPPPGATLFTSPHPGFAAPGIPLLAGGGNNDELSAFQVRYQRPDLRAFPLLETNLPICGPHSVALRDAANSDTEYGKAYFVDMRAGVAYIPQDQPNCDWALQSMRPVGAALLTSGW